MVQKKGNNQVLPEAAPAAGLSPAALEARKAYQRQYYQRNREKKQRWNQEYWERRATRETAAAAPDPEVTED